MLFALYSARASSGTLSIASDSISTVALQVVPTPTAPPKISKLSSTSVTTPENSKVNTSANAGIPSQRRSKGRATWLSVVPGLEPLLAQL